jgi:hypothetical protein
MKYRRRGPFLGSPALLASKFTPEKTGFAPHISASSESPIIWLWSWK